MPELGGSPPDVRPWTPETGVEPSGKRIIVEPLPLNRAPKATGVFGPGETWIPFGSDPTMCEQEVPTRTEVPAADTSNNGSAAKEPRVASESIAEADADSGPSPSEQDASTVPISARKRAERIVEQAWNEVVANRSGRQTQLEKKGNNGHGVSDGDPIHKDAKNDDPSSTAQKIGTLYGGRVRRGVGTAEEHNILEDFPEMRRGRPAIADSKPPSRGERFANFMDEKIGLASKKFEDTLRRSGAAIKEGKVGELAENYNVAALVGKLIVKITAKEAEDRRGRHSQAQTEEFRPNVDKGGLLTNGPVAPDWLLGAGSNRYVGKYEAPRQSFAERLRQLVPTRKSELEEPTKVEPTELERAETRRLRGRAVAVIGLLATTAALATGLGTDARDGTVQDQAASRIPAAIAPEVDHTPAIVPETRAHVPESQLPEASPQAEDVSETDAPAEPVKIVIQRGSGGILETNDHIKNATGIDNRVIASRVYYELLERFDGDVSKIFPGVKTYVENGDTRFANEGSGLISPEAAGYMEDRAQQLHGRLNDRE